MTRYKVTLTKIETYIVEASNMDEAEDKALDLCDQDGMAWTGPVDEIEVEFADWS